MTDFENMTLAELKELAKENNVKNISKLKKEDLIIVLKQILGDEKTSVTSPLYDLDTEIDPILEKKEIVERKYDSNGEPIVDYKLTNATDEIVEGILDILPI